MVRTSGTNQGYELDGTGNVFGASAFPSFDGSIPVSIWQEITKCSDVPTTVMFFAENPTTQQASNAVTEEVVVGSCVSPPTVTVVPNSAQVPVNAMQQFEHTVSNISNTAVNWSINGVGVAIQLWE